MTHLLIVDAFWSMQRPNHFSTLYDVQFFDMMENIIKVLVDDVSFGISFKEFLDHLRLILQRCEDINLVFNWEKCHFMV